MRILFTLLFAVLISSQSMTAQIYGNAQFDGPINFNPNYVIGYKIETGPNDTGVFTHIGVNDDPAATTCGIKLGIYDHNASANKPGALLTDLYISSPPNGIFNQFPLVTQPVITPNTIYWISIRTNCQYGSSQNTPTDWYMLPVHFKSHPFGSAWPDPYTGTNSYAGQDVTIFIVGNDQLLPVEMMSFNAFIDDEIPILDWAVASEINNDGWSIQRSTNGFTWNTIDWVDGQGNTNETTAYQYKDIKPLNNLVFYRLEQKDYDGTIAYSEVKSIYIQPKEISVFPNPAHDQIQLNGPDLGKSFIIKNVLGQTVRSSTFSDNNTIEINDFENGKYWIFLEDINQTISFLKQ